MDVMLQRHCARYIYIVPDGLRELMTDISREVLRCQPENMYSFIADYLDALLITRENARVAARLVQSIMEITITTLEFLQKTGMEREEASRIVDIIHEAFKKQVSLAEAMAPTEIDTEDVQEANIISDVIYEANIGPEHGEEAAKIIQHAFRNFKQRKEKEKELLSGMIDWRIAARSAIHLYRQTGVTNEEANRAATLIKAAYKGYYTRRVMKRLAAESKMLEQLEIEEETEVEEEVEADVEEDSAVVPSIKDERAKIHFDEDKGAAMSLQMPSTTTTTSAVVVDAIESILEQTFRLAESKREQMVGEMAEIHEDVIEEITEDEINNTEVIHESESPEPVQDSEPAVPDPTEEPIEEAVHEMPDIIE